MTIGWFDGKNITPVGKVVELGDNIMTKKQVLEREKAYLLRELEPFKGTAHSNPWALAKEEELRAVEKQLAELEEKKS